MTQALRQSWFCCFLVITLMIAGVQTAMHAVRADETSVAELQSYLASGGSLDALCINAENAQQHADCPLCREIEVFVLAGPVDCGATIALFSAPAVVFTAPRFVAAEPQSRPPARAPPRA